MLWHFTAEYALAGDVGRFSDDAIAKALCWDHASTMLVSCLVDAGWLDRCQCHRLRVHDWPQHADQTVSRVLTNRNQGFLKCYDDPSTMLASFQHDPSLPVPLPLPKAVPLPIPTPLPLPQGGGGHSQITTTPQPPEPGGQEKCVRVDLKTLIPDKRVTQTTSTNSDGVLQLCELLNGLYHRPSTDPWTYEEQRLAAEISKRQNWQEEWKLIHHYRRMLSEKRWFPQSLLALLQGWTKQLDKARIAQRSPSLTR